MNGLGCDVRRHIASGRHRVRVFRVGFCAQALGFGRTFQVAVRHGGHAVGGAGSADDVQGTERPCGAQEARGDDDYDSR
jgi:hypothetical protein